MKRLLSVFRWRWKGKAVTARLSLGSCRLHRTCPAHHLSKALRAILHSAQAVTKVLM